MTRASGATGRGAAGNNIPCCSRRPGCKMQKHGRRGCISYARHHARRPKHARTSSRDGLRLMTALDEYCHGCPVLASLPLLQIGAHCDSCGQYRHSGTNAGEDRMLWRMRSLIVKSSSAPCMLAWLALGCTLLPWARTEAPLDTLL